MSGLKSDTGNNYHYDVLIISRVLSKRNTALRGSKIRRSWSYLLL